MPARTITAVSRGGIVVPHTGNGRPRGDRPLSYHLYQSVCRLDPAGPISDLRKIRTRDHHYAPPPHTADNRLQRDAPSLSRRHYFRTWPFASVGPVLRHVRSRG